MNLVTSAPSPYYLLPSISEAPKTILPHSIFSPVFLSNVDYKEIISSTDLSEYVEKYVTAIGLGDVKQALEMLKFFFLNSEMLAQALVESVVKYVGVTDLKITEAVLGFVSNKNKEELTGIMVVLLTRKMASVPNKRLLYDDFIKEEKVIVKEFDKNKRKKKETKAVTQARFVTETVKGKENLDDVFGFVFSGTSGGGNGDSEDDDGDEKTNGAVAKKGRPAAAVKKLKLLAPKSIYSALSYAKEYYWAFPFQLIEVGAAELQNLRKEPFEFSKATNADKHLGIVLEKGGL